MENKNLLLFEIGKLIREVLRVLRNRFNEQIDQEIKITTEQYLLLNVIRSKESEVIQKDLAEHLGKDKSSVLRIIDTLESKELIRRVVDLKDRRKNYLMITKAGERVINNYEKISYKLMDELKHNIPKTDLDTFLRVLGQLHKNAEKLELNY
jgi:MarR family transcriptional regulator, transcriptional regulator for hemolysin